LYGFVGDHPGLKNVTAITTPPSSISNRPNLAKLWAQRFATMNGWQLVEAIKTRQTPPQKQISSEETEGDAVSRIAGSMQISSLQPGAEVLILDDTIRSGGTFIEL
jgi:adenine/guanine phosphoribosyltransferase-like PRPP-binding protein